MSGEKWEFVLCEVMIKVSRGRNIENTKGCVSLEQEKRNRGDGELIRCFSVSFATHSPGLFRRSLSMFDTSKGERESESQRRTETKQHRNQRGTIKTQL